MPKTPMVNIKINELFRLSYTLGILTGVIQVMAKRTALMTARKGYECLTPSLSMII